MASIVNADNGSVSGSAGLKSSADSSGVLALQTNGTTAISVSTGQVVTLTNALPVASGGTGVTTSTGSGANVLGTSPTLITPALGTPASGVLTNCTGLPQAGLAANVAGNGPAFNAYSASGTAMTNGAYVKVTFDTERFDTNNNFASSRFTPTVAGYYQINCNLVYLTTSTATQVVLALYKNGGVETYTNFINNLTNGESINLSYLTYMDGSTNYLEMYLYMAGTGTLSVQAGGQTTFNGSLVRSA